MKLKDDNEFFEDESFSGSCPICGQEFYKTKLFKIYKSIQTHNVGVNNLKSQIELAELLICVKNEIGKLINKT